MLKMSDIAQQAGVSASTVSLVLNGRHEQLRISEGTRQKVLRAAEEAGYRTNHQARATRTGKTRMVGIVGGALGTEQVARMVAGALDEIEAHDYTLKLLPSHPGDSPQMVQQIVRRGSELRLAGVIALHLPPTTLQLLQTEAANCRTPLVLLDTRAPGELTQIVSDDRGGITAVVAHLHGLGHRRIAMISGAPISTLASPREAAFGAAMQQYGLEVPPVLVQSGDFLERAPNLRAARALLDVAPTARPTALFCAGDFIALSALQVAAELQLRVPTDLSVVGFADFNVAEFAAPPLTTVRQDFAAMGARAARRLLQLCDADALNAPSAPNLLELLPTQLIVRGTTGPAP